MSAIDASLTTIPSGAICASVRSKPVLNEVALSEPEIVMMFMRGVVVVGESVNGRQNYDPDLSDGLGGRRHHR